MSKLLAALLATCIATGAAAQDARLTAITDANVVDIDTGKTIANAVVLIENDKITRIGTAAEVSVPAGARRLSMPGKWLVPGLMNMHVHLGLVLPGAQGAELANETDAEQTLRMAANARDTLRAGVTTVRFTHTDNGNDFALDRAIKAGYVQGPRIETAGELIVPTAGHGFREVDGPYGFANAVRTQFKRGATWIKIAISGGISDTHGAIGAAPMTDEEMKVLVEVAHRNNMKVTAHNGSVQAAEQALRYGIDCFEHGYYLDDATLKQMKAKGVWLVPTIVVSQPGAYEFYKKIGSPPWYLKRVEMVGKQHWAMLQTAIKQGVNIALGTDQMPFEPNDGTTSTVAEAELYAKAGMTPVQALQAATIQPARMLGLDKEVGRLAPGYYADIIAVDADPTANISALRTIHFVMKGGSVIRDDNNPAAIDR
ncbi:amidohydrolase family protein [Polymorphobacter sp.]|uniref:amidohydrolase family protein n=1 Tax=Polymorphobacter sp. TaxID=1909290 RepID=UPI003F6E60CC